MTRIFILFLFLLNTAPAFANNVTYFSDPLFEPLSAKDKHPLSDLKVLAENGDQRAQFILGDLHVKGKGGFPQDIDKAYDFFEHSAKSGYNHALIRLAAIAKKDGAVLEAYKWYSLAIESFSYGDTRKYLLQARKDLIQKYNMERGDIKLAKKQMKKWRKNDLPPLKTASTEDVKQNDNSNQKDIENEQN